MPRKTQDKKRPFTDNPNWKGFIRCELDGTLRSRFDEWSKTFGLDEVMSGLTGGIAEGFKLSIGYDFQNGVFVASMAGNDPDQPQFFGWTLTARASTWERAAEALYYKHFIIMEEDWRDHMALRDDNRGSDWVQ